MNNYFLPKGDEIKSKINLVLYFTILAYIVSLFLNNAPVVTNILMGLIFVLSFFSSSPDGYWKRLLSNRVNVGIIIFYLYQIVSVLLSENIRSGLAILILRLPLFILPISFCFIDFEKKIWDKVLLFYAIATTFASMLGFLFGVYQSVIENDAGSLYNDNISDFIGKQAVYFSFYVGVAIIILVVRMNQYLLLFQKHSFLIYTGIIWLLFVMFMLASRTAMFGTLLVLALYAFKVGIQKKKIFEIFLIFFSLIVGSVIMSRMFPKTMNRFNGTTETSFQFNNQNVENHFNEEYDKSKWNGTNTRVAVWSCAYEIWKAKPLMGTGLGDRNAALMKKYREKQFWYGLGTQKNTHNQYLDVMLSMGVVGLMVFLVAFLIYPIKLAFSQRQFLSIMVCILLGLCFITENILDRYQGLIFVAFIIPLIFKVTDQNSVTNQNY